MSRTTRTLLTILAVSMLAWVAKASAADTLVREGATCDIPDGYNVAPYDGDFNSRGMEEFCVFPSKPFGDAIEEYLKSFTPPDLPACASGLVFGPVVQTFPCYEIRTE